MSKSNHTGGAPSTAPSTGKVGSTDYPEFSPANAFLNVSGGITVVASDSDINVFHLDHLEAFVDRFNEALVNGRAWREEEPEEYQAAVLKQREGRRREEEERASNDAFMRRLHDYSEGRISPCEWNEYLRESGDDVPPPASTAFPEFIEVRDHVTGLTQVTVPEVCKRLHITNTKRVTRS